MKKYYVNLLLSMVLCYGCMGCMALPPLPGESKAKGINHSSALKVISYSECKLNYCDPLVIVDTKLIPLDSATLAADKENSSSSWMELWVVDRKGTLIEYPVTFTQYPSQFLWSGIDVSITVPIPQ